MTALGYVHDGHRVQMTTTLAGATLLVDGFEGGEAISSLFEFRVRLLAENDALDMNAIVGQAVSISIGLPGGEQTHIHGIVGRFRQGGSGLRLTSYTADVYPKLWLLTKTRDARIFQNKSVPDIVKQMLTEHGVTDVKDSLTATYEPREYCVQYQETAFDFVSRLLESEGIFYYFEHTSTAHTLVLADAASAFATGVSDPLLVTPSATDEPAIDAVPECSLEVQVTSGQVTAADFDFEQPAVDVLGTASGDPADLSVFEYPAGDVSVSVVETIATRRLEALEVPRRVLRGTCFHPALRPGAKFTLSDHRRADANAEWVVWRIAHTSSRDSYGNRFEAVAADAPFRPASVTPAPVIHGCQTAIVVGKSGEEITTDKYGRIKVKFHWDRAEGADENSSCWVRVAQGWAGKQWGSFFLPRIGQEVVVTFLEGNPDRPLVTGSVYNGTETVPYTLPDNQTRSTVKSESSKGGGGFNEIRFEDKKDSEELFVHAQKDMNVIVLNDQTSTITKNRTVTVKEVDDTLKVEKGNRAIEVAGKETHKVTGERSLTVSADETHTNAAKLTYKVDGDVSLTIGGKLTLKVTGDVSLDVTGSVAVKSNANVEVQATGNLKQQATGSMSSQALSITTKADTSLTTEAGTSLTSKSGAMHNVEAGAILVIKGALVKIN